MLRLRVAVLSGILFLSGCSALLFQTLWLRLCGLAFGNSVWVAALILSSFMAGLALGNALAAIARPPRLRPLQLYALLEVAVGLFGCTVVFGLPSLGLWLRPVWQVLWAHQALLSALRVLLSFSILLVPTTAMGLTLPVLLEDGVLRRLEFGRTLGLLYGCNTLGAVVGVAAGNFWLIKTVGLWGTGAAAGLLNLLAAGTACLVAVASSDSSSARPDPSPLGRATARQAPWRLLGASLGCGALLLGLELVWFRFLRLYVASTATAFAVMLAVVLLGIGLGGLASGILLRRGAQSPSLPGWLLSAAIGCLGSYVLFPVPVERGTLAVHYVSFWLETAGLALELTFPVALISGIIFPLIVARVQAAVPDRMNSTGLTTLCNTIGAACGPLLTGFVLLPRLGFQSCLLGCAAGYGLLAALVGDKSNWSLARPAGRVTFGLGGVLVLAFTFFPYQRDRTHFANARLPYEADGSRLVKLIEGTDDTFQLLRRDLFGQPYYYRLVTNGYSMSSTHPRSQRYMRLSAYLPIAFHPRAENALLLCYGVGVTADALTHDARLSHIDVVDISREVFALADDYTGPLAADPLRDSRVTTFVQDARFFLQASPEKYDIITGEPPPLKVAGTVNLYTEEFFTLLRSRLKPGGIATFWLPIYQLQVEETEAILRAFQHAFPEASVWGGPDQEWILMGMNGPPRRLTEDELRPLWRTPSTGRDLKRIGVEDPGQLAALFVMGPAEIARITRGVPPLTDRYPKRLSDAAPDREAVNRFAWTYVEAPAALARFRASRLIAALWPDEMTAACKPYFIDREIRYVAALKPGNWLAALDLYLRNSQLRAPVLEVLNSDEFRLSLAERLAHNGSPPPAAALPDLVAGALARRDLGAAIRLLEIERRRGFTNPNDCFLLTYLYCLNGDVPQAETLAAATAPSLPKDWFVEWLWTKLAKDFGFRAPS